MSSRYAIAVLSCVALALWVVLTLLIGNSPGFGSDSGYLLTPLALSGITAALRYPFRRNPLSWPAAAVAAPIIVCISLLLAAILTEN